MNRLYGLICAGWLCAQLALAQSPVTLAIGSDATGPVIPEDFVGLSFGMKALLPDKAGAHIFSATNTPLITLFQNVGLHHLRFGGTTVESPPATPIPGEKEIDNLFAFAREAGVKKIIYSLRLLETDSAPDYAATNVVLAQYIWNHYRPSLECFALGNEPDVKRVFNQDRNIRDFPTYLERWRAFAAAITRVLPEAKFAGPDAGSGNVYWTTHFADAEKDSGLISVITEHFYAGGRGKGLTSAEGIEGMLSAAWDRGNQALYDKMAKPVLADGLSYRFTEANDHYSGGIANASDTFAGALWALDFLHWWAAHRAKGIDFHNTQWVVSDIVKPAGKGRWTINPKGYGLKAFDLGGHGMVEPVTISNAQGINLTAYAVRDGKNLFVTVINKEYGANARAARVTFDANGTALAISLTASHGDVGAKTGVTLGGGFITDENPWQEHWSLLPKDALGHWDFIVPSTSATIVKIIL
jgi:hypothetical protein